jgi:hypothetical protein
MSMEVVRHEVGMMRARVNRKISDAIAQLEHGTDREKVDAAGELGLLARHRAALDKRILEIDAHGDAGDSVSQWFIEEIFNLNLLLESWIAHA